MDFNRIEHLKKLLAQGGAVRDEDMKELAEWMDLLDQIILPSVSRFYQYSVSGLEKDLASLAVWTAREQAAAFIQDQKEPEEIFILEIAAAKGNEQLTDQVPFAVFQLTVLLDHLDRKLDLHTENYQLLIQAILFYSRIAQSLQRLRQKGMLPNDLERVVLLQALSFIEAHQSELEERMKDMESTFAL